MLRLVIFIVSNLFAFDMITPTVSDDYDIKDYYVSEKLDGLRGYWDGKNLYSKNKNLYTPPKDFIKDFPPFVIDGELYCGKEFEKTLSDVKSSKFNCAKLYVFEVPFQKGDLKERLKVLKDYLKTHPNDNIKIIEQLEFNDEKSFQEYFDELKKQGAEGVVLHKKYEDYHTKKGKSLIKIKHYQTSQCEIIKLNYTRNLLKNYECKWNDKIIKIGSGFSNDHRKNPLNVGKTISFKYYRLSKNKIPIHTVFISVIE